MPTSYNGWTASESRAALGIVKLTVGGVDFVPGVRAGDVHTVLQYVAQQVHERVERAHNPGCWGYAFRMNRNSSNLSCHASGTAFDFNAPRHPNGVRASRNFSTAQMTTIRAILREVDDVVRWGGDYRGTPDAMHFEINASRTAVAAVARKLNGKKDDDMTPEQIAGAPMTMLSGPDDKPVKKTFQDVLRDLEGTQDKHGKAIAAQGKQLDRIEALLSKPGTGGTVKM